MAATLRREEGENLPVLVSGFRLGKKEKWRGGEWCPKERKLFLFFSFLFQVVAIGESVANSYGAIQHFGQRENFLGGEVEWKPDGCE